jgi:hypothetical protein
MNSFMNWICQDSHHFVSYYGVQINPTCTEQAALGGDISERFYDTGIQ